MRRRVQVLSREWERSHTKKSWVKESWKLIFFTKHISFTFIIYSMYLSLCLICELSVTILLHSNQNENDASRYSFCSEAEPWILTPRKDVWHFNKLSSSQRTFSHVEQMYLLRLHSVSWEPDGGYSASGKTPINRLFHIFSALCKKRQIYGAESCLHK